MINPSTDIIRNPQTFDCDHNKEVTLKAIRSATQQIAIVQETADEILRKLTRISHALSEEDNADREQNRVMSTLKTLNDDLAGLTQCSSILHAMGMNIALRLIPVAVEEAWIEAEDPSQPLLPME